MKILFVCHGNICRSPMAEFIMRELLRRRGMDERVEVASAAVSTEEIGNPVYPPAKACLVRHGIPLDSAKRARQITRGDYDAYDHIICMDRSNLRLLRHIIPDDPAGKVSLMMSWTGEALLRTL